ncbi:sensor histidine kinase [Nonomuraea sp. SBT364]|uniref:sensor histidine kinase n=1 Tax=Nonomuraea sp. SBT364 TaxID=1580530 RepID=UPI0009E9DA3A|nr:sensor histidine kinase [Nonomuraea sp. SBT364]
MPPDRAPSSGEPSQHVAVPYGSDEGFLDLAVPRIRRALADGRRVLVVTRPARLSLLAEALDGELRDVDCRDSGSWYDHPQRTLATCYDYAHGRRTLLVGEPVWTGLGEIETREWIRYESVFNTALSGVTTDALCFYDVRTVPANVMRYAAMTHPLVFGPNGERPSPHFVSPDELVLNGDRGPLPEPTGRVRTVRFTADRLTELRRTVAGYAEAAGMDRDLTASLVLSVSEIAANSIEHGPGHGLVRMWTSGEGVVCEISDPGGPLEDPLPGYIPPEPESLRGYGLWISRQLCDLVELRADDGMLRVRLHMRLRA